MIADDSLVVRVPQDEAAKVIGKAGRNIDQLEKALGMHIDVRTREEEGAITPRIEETARHLVLWIGDGAGESVDVYVGGDQVLTATVGRRGDIRMAKSSDTAKQIIRRIKKGDRLEARRTEY